MEYKIIIQGARMKRNFTFLFPSLIVFILLASFGSFAENSSPAGSEKTKIAVSKQKMPLLHIGQTSIVLTSLTGTSVQITLISIDGVTRIRDYVDVTEGTVDAYMNTRGIVPGSYVCLVNTGNATLKKRVTIAR